MPEHKPYGTAVVHCNVRVYSQEAITKLLNLKPSRGISEQHIGEPVPGRDEQGVPCHTIAMSWRWTAHQGWSVRNDASQRLAGAMRKLQYDADITFTDRVFDEVCPCHPSDD